MNGLLCATLCLMIAGGLLIAWDYWQRDQSIGRSNRRAGRRSNKERWAMPDGQRFYEMQLKIIELLKTVRSIEQRPEEARTPGEREEAVWCRQQLAAFPPDAIQQALETLVDTVHGG